jgi:outer membrane receptor protein involved in Fe transport
MNKAKLILLTSISTLASSLGVTAYAQTSSEQTPAAEASRGKVFDTIVVTAQKREQDADDIGMTISVVGGDALDQLGVTNTADLSRLVPGFTFAETGLTVPVYTIRGVGYSDTSVQAQSTVGVYNDQVAVPYPIMTAGPQLDLQRVEVLKGPQGTLYGRNSTGGAINYIANRPTDEFEASINAEYGRFDTLDFSGFVSGPLTDKVGARLAVRTIQSSEGWQESVSRDETLGEQDKLAARLLLDFDLSENLSLDLAYNYWSDNSDTQAPQFFRVQAQRPDRTANLALYDASANPRISLLGTDDVQAADWTADSNIMPDPVADMTSHSFSGTLKWDMSEDVTLTSLTSYATFENNSGYDYSGWAGMPLDTSADGGVTTARDTITTFSRALYDDVNILGGVGFVNDAEIDAFSQELRFDGVAGPLTWIAGAYYSQDEVDSVTRQQTDFSTGSNSAVIFFGNGLQGVTNLSNTESQSWALFGHTEWELNDALNLTVGLRYTEDEKEFSGCTADDGSGSLNALYGFFRADPFGVFDTPGGCAMFDFDNIPRSEQYTDELKEDSLSWRLGLDYNVTDDTLLYATYSRGFKAGSFPTLTGNLWEALQPVVQEQVDAYEVGVKSSLFGNTLQFNGAAFYYDYTDKQLRTKFITIFGPGDSLANIEESTVQGAEFDVSWFPVDDLYISFGGTYIDSEVKDYTGYNQLGLQGSFAGSEFPLTPEFQAFALANYDFKLNESINGFVNMNLSYTSESSADYDIAEVFDDGSARYPDILALTGATVGAPFAQLQEFELPEAVEIGANIGIASVNDTWTVSLWGRNLTDEYTLTNVARTADNIIAWTGRPRTYGVSLGYKF